MELDQLKQLIIEIYEPIVHREIRVDNRMDDVDDFKRLDHDKTYLFISCRNKGRTVYTSATFNNEFIEDMRIDDNLILEYLESGAKKFKETLDDMKWNQIFKT